MNDALRRIAEGGAFDVVDAVRLLAKQAVGAAVAAGAGAPVANGEDVTGLFNARMAKALRDAGLTSSAAIRAASDEELAAIPGLGEKGVALVRERVARA
jgi:DNA uptake protein ComE-like DNA-binding protein